MIKKLGIEDKQKYIEHVARTLDKKGLVFYKEKFLVEQTKELELQENHLDNLFSDYILDPITNSKNSFHIWAKFDNDSITQSFKTFYHHNSNSVTILSYKSEITGTFKPKKDLLPLLEQLMYYFEQQKVYNYYLVRRVGFFEWKKNLFFEDLSPLNRYNCYFDEVIPANVKSSYLSHRQIASDLIFPKDTGVVHMALKQEHRTYYGKKILPDTKEMFDKIQNKKNFCVIGYNPNTQKIGNYLYSNYSVNHNVHTVGRDNFDFNTDDWEVKLKAEIDKLNQPLVIIINIFNYDKMNMQQKIFNFIWSTYKMQSNVHIVVVGSVAHYADKNLISEQYFDAKKELHDSCFNYALQDYYTCKLLLVEPGVVESYVKNSKPNWPSFFIKDDEFAKKILSFIDLNEKFMSVSLIGSHLYRA